MLGGPILLIGSFIGIVAESTPDFSGGLCLIMFLPWIMFHSGIMLDIKDFVSNIKAIIFRGIVDNLVSLACISIGTYFLFPIMGIGSLHFTDHLVIGAVLMPNNFMLNFPTFPYPFIELIDDHSIVFGEGALGIALSLMLLKHVKSLDSLHLTSDPKLLFQLCGYISYVFVASSLLGVLVGLLLSIRGFFAKLLIFKYFDSGYHLVFLRGATFVLFIPAYLSYILAEYLHLSGTLCVFFYGLTTANYILPEDPEVKAYWRDDIYRIFTILKWLSLSLVGATSVTMNQWTSLENRRGAVFGVSATLLFTLMFGKFVSVYPLSWCRVGRKTIQKLATDPIFANPWRVGDLNARWSITKAKTTNHKLNPLLFNRWGLSKIESQVMIMANVENAETYLQGLTWGSVLMPSMLSYVFAYDQFKKTEDNQMALVHICIVIVYLGTLMIFGVWDRWTKRKFEKQSPALFMFCFYCGEATISYPEAPKKN
ncbi:hypothetical protein QQ045_026398 [Rhodiola kirilowii]